MWAVQGTDAVSNNHMKIREGEETQEGLTQPQSDSSPFLACPGLGPAPQICSKETDGS